MIRPAEYELDSAISQSDINLFERNIVEYHNTKILGLGGTFKKSDALDLGSIMDAILLDPDALKGYYVMTDMRASGKLKEVVDFVYNVQFQEPDTKPAEKLEFCIEYIKKGIKALDYQANWREETRINKIKEEGAAYYEQLLEANGRVIVSLDSWETAHARVNEMQEDEFIGGIVKLLKEGSSSDEVVIKKTVPLYGTYAGRRQKGLLDFIIEYPKQKTVWPWDLKSCKSLALFLSNYRKSRYGRQGSFYTNLVEQNYPGWKVVPFSFLAIPTRSNEFPEHFQMSTTELYGNAEGVEMPSGYKIKGWKQLIDEEKWHTEKGKWKHRFDYYLSGVNVIAGNANVDPALLEPEDDTPIF